MRHGAERSRGRLSTLDASVEPPRSGSLSRGPLVETAHDRRQTPPRDTNDPGPCVQQIDQLGSRSSGLPDLRRFLGYFSDTRAAAQGKAEPVSHNLTGDEPLRSPHAAHSHRSEGSALNGSRMVPPSSSRPRLLRRTLWRRLERR